MSIGYCCISLGINQNKKPKEQISVNRGMIKKTFEAKGLQYVSELVKQNLKDTSKIIDWNIQNNIKVYRLSSDSFPWMSHYLFKDLPDFDTIKTQLEEIGNKVKLSNMRVSLHPGPFSVLSSENPEVVNKTIDELDKHSQILDMMGLEQSTYYPVNIHVGSTKPSREEASERFCSNFVRLSESTKKRLTIENDDSQNQYSVFHLYEMVYKKISIPIVIDSLHHECFTDNKTWEESLRLAVSTWKTKPICHHSSSKKIHEVASAKLEAHADFLYSKFDTCGLEVDIELECKQKDIALFRYRKDFL